MNTEITGDALLDAVRLVMRSELDGKIGELHTFVDRRIAELSVEVHAAVQMVDYSEANLAGQLTRMHEEIVQLVAMPTAATRSSGLELEAVVQATEAAANTIMEAAEAIQAWLSGDRQDEESLKAVAEKVDSIFEACSFQDVTGQRIRRAIQHLQQVETMLTGLVPDGAASKVEQVKVTTHRHTVSEPERSTADLDQEAIDLLLKW